MFPELVYPPVVDLADRHGIQEVQLFAPVAPRDHEARGLEHLQMFHDAEARHLQLPLELAERLAVALAQQVQQEPARGVRQRLEDQVVINHGPDYM